MSEAVNTAELRAISTRGDLEGTILARYWLAACDEIDRLRAENQELASQVDDWYREKSEGWRTW